MSVLIPVFNAADSLKGVLADLRAQTLREWEAVFVDDGSTDGSSRHLDHAALADPRIHVLHMPHGGIATALNAGLELCRAPVVARMDADDRMSPDRLERLAAHLAANPGVGLVSSLVEFGGDRRVQAGYAAYVDWVNSITSHADISLTRFVESPLAHPSVAFRRELAARYGGYRIGPFPEDYELWLRWIECGVRMEKIPQTLLRWNDPPNRLSRTDSRYSQDAFFATKAPFLARETEKLRGNRPLWLWGAGRRTRRRMRHLEEHGCRPAGYVDIDPRKLRAVLPDNRPVIAPAVLPPPLEAFVLGCVGKRGARELIRATLTGHGYREGLDFLMCA